MIARWHPDALAEADAAAEFYRDKRCGLARRFLNSLDEALNHIELHPYIDRAPVDPPGATNAIVVRPAASITFD